MSMPLGPHAPAIARVDAEGNLVEADSRIERLNARAGGALGAPIAIPQLAAVVRLAGRLRIAIARQLTASDGEAELDLTVRATPDGDYMTVEVSGWQERLDWQPTFTAEREGDFIGTDAGWTWETDAALRIVSIAAHGESIPGVDPVAMLGQPLTRLFIFSESGSGDFPILTAMAGQDRFAGQSAKLRATGAEVHLSAVPRADASGRFAGFVGSAEPIEPSESLEGDEDDVGGSAGASEAIVGTAFTQRLDRALRRPLARIIANADSIYERTEGPLGQDYADYAGDIASAGRHLMGLVEDLVDLDAVERADFTTDVEPLDLADVARRAAGLLSVRASGAGVSIDRPGPEDRVPATGEFRRALQVLVNLVGNAVRYSPRGGTIWIRVERDGERACVIVADQGKGIALADQDRIFAKFERLDESEIGGSGLGLYIARKLARAMGGDLIVDSAPGEGARFIFCLPI